MEPLRAPVARQEGLLRDGFVGEGARRAGAPLRVERGAGRAVPGEEREGTGVHGGAGGVEPVLASNALEGRPAVHALAHVARVGGGHDGRDGTVSVYVGHRGNGSEGDGGD